MSEMKHPALDEFDAAMKSPRERLAAMATECGRLRGWSESLRAELKAVRKQLADEQSKRQSLLTRYQMRQSEMASMREQLTALEAELAEARKQPVAQLPTITRALYDEWLAMEGCESVEDQWNAVLRRHFRQAEPEAKQVPPVLGPPSDWQTNRGEAIATLVHRVEWETQRATRRECAEFWRRFIRDHPGAKGGKWFCEQELVAAIDRMERGK